MTEKSNQTKNPFDMFFNLGNKVTKGDPVRKIDFDYYLLWIMFCAFFSIMLSNFIAFLDVVKTNLWGSLKPLGWTFVMIAILWFQYNGLAQTYQTRKMVKETYASVKNTNVKLEDENLEIENVDDMLKDFEEEKVKGGKSDVK